MSEEFLIFGAGGHARVVIASLFSQGLRLIKIFDDDSAKKNTVLLGCSVFGTRQALVEYQQKNKQARLIVAIGVDRVRKKIYQELIAQGVEMGQAIHADTSIAPGVILGKGLMIMARAVVNPDAQIGNNVIINTGVIIEHDCMIGNHSHIAPGAVLCGGVKVGGLTLIGAGAVVLPGIQIGHNCVVAAGAVVCEDVADGSTVMGIPAKLKG
jgi:sugar O-acyltransferase (sialic acid O-acetyltransferase NeuD family)